MSRSIVLTPLIVLVCGLGGCRAQEERRELQNSVTRLEQRLKSMDQYLKELQQSQGEQQNQRATAVRDKQREAQQLLRAKQAEV